MDSPDEAQSLLTQALWGFPFALLLNHYCLFEGQLWHVVI